MVTIIKTEFMKLKRYFIVWIGVSLMLLTVLLTLFTTMADDGMVWDYRPCVFRFPGGLFAASSFFAGFPS